MAVIHIDGKAYEVRQGENLLKTCLGLGFDLPYFCWHPAMHSVGACRQCAVKQFRDENDTRGSIVMACMTPVTDGMRISMDDPETRKFRSGVIEWMMIEPSPRLPGLRRGRRMPSPGHDRHDRPLPTEIQVQEEDLHKSGRWTVCGPRDEPVHLLLQVHEILQRLRGREDFGAFAAHNSVYFGRAGDGVLESPFAGIS